MHIKPKIFILFSILIFGGIISPSAANLIKKTDIGTYNKKKFLSNDYLISQIKWEKVKDIKANNQKYIHWEKISIDEYKKSQEMIIEKNDDKQKNYLTLNSLNRSIVFNDSKTGPDIAWIVPIGLRWSKKHNFDSSIRGHNRRKEGEKFLAWNEGDAVGQFYYQPIKFNDSSLGLNIGFRSVYQGSIAGGGTPIGEGMSLGFRYDRSLTKTSGFAFGAEQLLHFDGKTDTGRDIYLTFTKGWWQNPEFKSYPFPLTVTTFGLGTGKLAEGNIKGFCSNLFGGSGTEIAHQRSLCWAPIFNIARVHNEYFSTFFEYNSKLFLLGSSLSPFKKVPLRGTLALQLSDHIDNYKINNFQELKWVFRLSLGF